MGNLDTLNSNRVIDMLLDSVCSCSKEKKEVEHKLRDPADSSPPTDLHQTRESHFI